MNLEIRLPNTNSAWETTYGKHLAFYSFSLLDIFGNHGLHAASVQPLPKTNKQVEMKVWYIHSAKIGQPKIPSVLSHNATRDNISVDLLVIKASLPKIIEIEI